MSFAAGAATHAANTQDWMLLRDALVTKVSQAPLDRDPFCHMYFEQILPASLYPSLLSKLPPADLYSPLNLRKWARADGTSTRDMFYLTPENLAKLPHEVGPVWRSVLNALTDRYFKRALFARLAPDMAERFGVSEDRVPDLECVYDLSLVRDTEDYRIKPHPDGLNNLVTMQFYLPEDESNLGLGTSVYRRQKKLLGSSFEEVKRFPFKPNSAYAFAVSDGPNRTSWHGRDWLSGFTGVRNTMILSFRQTTPREYAS
jgi:hypothetical protein